MTLSFGRITVFVRIVELTIGKMDSIMAKMKEVPTHVYSDIRNACAYMLTEEEDQLLNSFLFKGNRTIKAKYKIMLRVLLSKSYGSDVYSALRNE